MNAFALTAPGFCLPHASCAAYKDPNESINECGERLVQELGTPALTAAGSTTAPAASTGSSS
uniref:Secreted protein n=1 Tax=Macrostomum lignano TaxID=282301 RepID=A0A1I8FP83_9PLAT